MKSKKQLKNEAEISLENLKQMFNHVNDEHIKLLNWPYTNHKIILREWEEYNESKLRLEFA